MENPTFAFCFQPGRVSVWLGVLDLESKLNHVTAFETPPLLPA
jgi:hypothetical protein